MTAPSPTPEHTPGLRTGAEVAGILAPIAAAVQPHEAAPLVMPATILAVAGMKGRSYAPDMGDVFDLVDRMNTANPDPLIRFVAHECNDGEFIIENLAGLERTTSLSKLPGILRFDGRLGFDAYGKFRDEQLASFRDAVAAGAYPWNTDPLILEKGIAHGYPDQAILDRERHTTTQSQSLALAMQLTEIEQEDEGSSLVLLPKQDYDEGGADFWIRADHQNDPGVRAYINTARAILREFAATPFAKYYREDPRVQLVLEHRRIAQSIRRQLEGLA